MEDFTLLMLWWMAYSWEMKEVKCVCVCVGADSEVGRRLTDGFSVQ